LKGRPTAKERPAAKAGKRGTGKPARGK